MQARDIYVNYIMQFSVSNFCSPFLVLAISMYLSFLRRFNRTRQRAACALLENKNKKSRGEIKIMIEFLLSLHD